MTHTETHERRDILTHLEHKEDVENDKRLIRKHTKEKSRHFNRYTRHMRNTEKMYRTVRDGNKRFNLVTHPGTDGRRGKRAICNLERRHT